jgi:DnaJ-domain-containing protein 1
MICRLLVAAAIGQLLLIGLSNEAFAQVAPNAYVSGTRWYCPDGFKRVEDQCEQVIAPVIGYVSGNCWYCREGSNRFADLRVSASSIAPGALEKSANGSISEARTQKPTTPRSNRQDANSRFEGISNVDQIMIESACHSARLVQGPAAYHGCLDEQVAALRRRSSRPDLTSVSQANRSVIESACHSARLVQGPAAYYDCVATQIQSLPFRADIIQASEGAESDVESIPNRGRPSADKSVLDPAIRASKKQAPIARSLASPESSEQLGVQTTPRPYVAVPQAPLPPATTKPNNSTPKSSSASAWGGLLFVVLILAGLGRAATRVAAAKAESRRRAEEQQRADEEERRQEEIRREQWKREEDARRRAEQPRRQNEEARRRQDERRREQAKRNEEEPRRAEEQRRAEHSRREKARQEERRRNASSDENGSTNGRATIPFDPYAVLGIKPGASKQEIQTAYREAMSQYHPDKVAHLGTELQDLATKKAQEFNKAYDMLRGK